MTNVLKVGDRVICTVWNNAGSSGEERAGKIQIVDNTTIPYCVLLDLAMPNGDRDRWFRPENIRLESAAPVVAPVVRNAELVTLADALETLFNERAFVRPGLLGSKIFVYAWNGGKSELADTVAVHSIDGQKMVYAAELRASIVYLEETLQDLARRVESKA